MAGDEVATERAWVLAQLAGLAALLLAAAARGGDPLVVQHTAARAGDASLASPEWLDHAQQAQRLRPWQPGFGAARETLDRVDVARRGPARDLTSH